jgi:DNA repair protein RadC
MARTTRATRGLNDAPDLLALIERDRAASARAGASQSISAPLSTAPSTFAQSEPVPRGAAQSGHARSGPGQFDIAPPSPAMAGTDGHRARMRARLLTAGAEALADHEMLEMTLFLALPRRDTKPLARLLLTRFGSFAGTIAAPVSELATIDGLGEAGMAALKLVQAAALRLLRSEVSNRPVLANWDRLLDYLTASVARERVEQFRVLFLDAGNRLLADELQARGTVNHTPVYPREVVKRALELHATALILVHNHPSGDPTPSTADFEMTREIRNAADALSITLYDHIIVGNGRCLSFSHEGLLQRC